MFKKYLEWTKRHKILTGIGVFILLAAALGPSDPPSKTSSTQNQQTQSKTQAKVQAQPDSPEETVKPKYEVLGYTTTERFDKAEVIYVVVEPIDLSNDRFKHTMKEIVKDLASRKNFKEFSAYIYDDNNVANREYAKELPNGAEDAKAKLEEPGVHLVANYSGGIDYDTAKKSTTDSAYIISYYPGAFKGTPAVGQYVGTEKFKP